jgi:hypothetical protein
MDVTTLSPEQEQLAAELLERLTPLYQQEAQRVARLFATKSVSETLGKTEFQLRDRLHELAAASLQSALEGRKKGATKTPR